MDENPTRSRRYQLPGETHVDLLSFEGGIHNTVGPSPSRGSEDEGPVVTRIEFDQNFVQSGRMKRLLLLGALACAQCKSPSSLSGNAAFRATAISSVQVLSAGASMPFAALQAVSPEGAAALGKMSLGLGNESLGLMPQSMPSDAMFLPALNLYIGDAIFSGAIATIPFFSDSAATISAGSVTITLPIGTTETSGEVDFPSYPDDVKIEIAITGGNLPTTGEVTVHFESASGANTMTGSFTTKGVITTTLDLTLSDSLDVGGTITIVQNGETMTCGPVSGQAIDSLNCNVKVSPQGWSGTGSFNLLTGDMHLNITGAGNATLGDTGGLNITYSDGSSETIASPDTVSLTGTAGSGNDGGTSSSGDGGNDGGTNSDGGSSGSDGGGSVTFSSATFAPTTTMLYSIVKMNDSHQILGLINSGSTLGGVFLSSPSASAQSLSGTVSAMNNSGHIVGYSMTDALYWATPGGSPQTLAAGSFPRPQPYAITDADEIIGRSINGTIANFIYWSSPTAQPAALPLPSGYGANANYIAIATSSDGRIVSNYFDHTSNALSILYWSSAAATPTFTAVTALVSGFTVNSQGAIIAHANGVGNCIGFSYWSSPTATPANLPAIDGDPDCGNSFSDISNSGIVVGQSALAMGNSQTHAVFWQNGAIKDLNDYLPQNSTAYLGSAEAINANNEIAVRPFGTLAPDGNDNISYVIVTLH